MEDSDSLNGLKFVDVTQQVNNETEASENKESESEDAGSENNSNDGIQAVL